MKLILLSLSLLGLGAIGGYITFHLMLSSRCSHLLVETESRHKLALKDLQAKNQKTTEELNKCTHDEGTKKQLLELQGRLEAQSVLADHHRDLLAQYDVLKGDVQKLQEEKEFHVKVIDEHRVAVEDLQNKLQVAATSGEGAVEAREELERVQRSLSVVQRDMEHFRERLEVCVADRHRSDEDAKQLRATLNEKEEVLHQVNERLVQVQEEVRRRDEEEENRRREWEEEEQRRREEEEEEHRRRQEEEEEHRRRQEEEEEEHRRRLEEEEAHRRAQEEEHHHEPEQHHHHQEGEEL